MIFLRAGGQWLFEKPASLSPFLRLSLSLSSLLVCLSPPPSAAPSLLSPALPALQYPNPNPQPPESRHRAGCDNGNIPLSASRFSR